MVALLVLFTILVFLSADYVAARRKQRAEAPVPDLASSISARPTPRPSGVTVAPLPALGLPALYALPVDAIVHPGHVCLWPGAEGTIRIGPDPLMLTLLGGLGSVYPLSEGAEVQAGAPLVMLRNGNRALKVRSPLPGRIRRVNRALCDHPEQLSLDNIEAGWIYEITPTRRNAAPKAVVLGEQAAEWLRSEALRLRDAVLELASRTTSGRAIHADGGLPLDELGETIGERIADNEWEELVIRFFGPSAH